MEQTFCKKEGNSKSIYRFGCLAASSSSDTTASDNSANSIGSTQQIPGNYLYK